MRYDYEDAFNHFKPDYLGKGQKNVARYAITGLYTNNDYFRFYAENRKEVEEWLNDLRNRANVNPASIAIQNRFGQLLWNSETGASDIAPKFMNGTTDDSDQCFYTGFWNDSTGF